MDRKQPRIDTFVRLGQRLIQRMAEALHATKRTTRATEKALADIDRRYSVFYIEQAANRERAIGRAHIIVEVSKARQALGLPDHQFVALLRDGDRCRYLVGVDPTGQALIECNKPEIMHPLPTPEWRQPEWRQPAITVQ